jgi:hypothetical protein
LESGCAYVLGNQIDPLGKPECKENKSKTLIMKPRLWGESLKSRALRGGPGDRR